VWKNLLEDHADLVVLVLLAVFLIAGLAGYDLLRER
jgi:uncharacterized membrane protein